MSTIIQPSVTELQRRRLLIRTGVMALIVLVLLAIGAVRTVLIRSAQLRQIETASAVLAKQYVTTIRAAHASDNRHIDLPGTLQGFIESPIYARSNGYLLHWYKDIGSRVKKGDLLADIDTPEIDQQLAQAIATRRQTAANLELAKSSKERWEQMRQRDVVSQQELDERNSAYAQAQANLTAADAEVRRLQDLVGFKQIIAPFPGILTRRNFDIGDLITPGNGDSSRALFILSQTDPLRLYVYVPQSYAEGVKPGQQVEVSQSEMPGQVFHGRVERTAGAIDKATRTLQIEIMVPNPNGRLMPGAYVKVSLPTGAASTLTIPSNALLFRSEGPRVAVVESGGKVRLQAVTIGQDFGNTLEILEGVRAADRLVLNPPDSLVDGAVVVATDQPSTSGSAK